MNSAVAAVARRVPDDCHAADCDKDECRVDLTDAPAGRIIVDMDCDSLGIPIGQKRCDYLFVGEEAETTYVVVIEFKSGGFRVRATVAQLEAEAEMADDWLPQGIEFRFVPVLVHGKFIGKNIRRELLLGTIRLREQKKKVALVRSGNPLTEALRA